MGTKRVEKMDGAGIEVPSFKAVDTAIHALTVEMKQEDAPIADTQIGRIEHLLQVYRGLKPLLTVLSALPLILTKWRNALAVFTQALEAVAVGASDLADFKAGKDI
jgi:hypothetical protein